MNKVKDSAAVPDYERVDKELGIEKVSKKNQHFFKIRYKSLY